MAYSLFFQWATDSWVFSKFVALFHQIPNGFLASGGSNGFLADLQTTETPKQGPWLTQWLTDLHDRNVVFWYVFGYCNQIGCKLVRTPNVRIGFWYLILLRIISLPMRIASMVGSLFCKPLYPLVDDMPYAHMQMHTHRHTPHSSLFIPIHLYFPQPWILPVLSRRLPADFVKWDKLQAGVSTMAMEPGRNDSYATVDQR